MKFNRIFVLAVVIFLVAGLAMAAAVRKAPQVRFVKPQQQVVAAAAELLKTGLQGTISVKLPLEQALSSMTCADLSMHVGTWQTPPPQPGDLLSVPVFNEVRSGVVSGTIGSGKCTYKVSGVPSGTAYDIYVYVNQAKFNCNVVYLYQQPPQAKMTFTKGQMAVLDLQVSPHCAIVK